MQKIAIYGIIAAIVVAAGTGVAVAAMSMNGNTATTASTNSNDVKVIKHAMGETEITGTPERIVVLEWVYAEDLLALGVQPVGVADIEGMKQWVNLKGLSLSPDAIDVGTRQEPNLERISSLDPDLIIAPQFRVEQTYESLSTIAPTVAFNPYPEEGEGIGQLEEMEQTFMTIADVIGRHDKGVEMLENLENYYAEAAEKIRSAGASDREFVMVQAFTTENVPHLRIFTDNSMAVQIMNKVGLQNAWDVEYELYGFTETGIEPLAEVQDANFFYIVQDNDNPFANQWNTPVWRNLEFVKEGRTYPLGGDTWLFGGPISAEVVVDKVIGTLTGDSDQTKNISHAMGETTITGIPERILAIGPEFTEHLLTLDVQPAGIIDSTTLRIWYPSVEEQLSPDVVDLGDYPPNIEAIAQLKPDLILGEAGLYGEFYEDLSDIAPTVLYDLFPDEGEQTQLERMTDVHMSIADIVGRHDRGVANIESMHAKFDEAATKLEAAGLAGHRFIYLEAGVWEDAPWMFVYAKNAELSLILEEIGLENAVGDDMEFDRRGFIDSSLEGLAAMDGPDVHMFYTTALGGDVFQDSKYWAENPVWTNLEFVKAGQVHNLDKVYAFAGPSQAELLADKVVEALT